MSKNYFGIFVIVAILFLIKCIEGVPKYENKNSNQENQWRRVYLNEKLNDTVSDSTKDRIQRLGYTTGYGGINGYPGSGTGISSYNPVKLDLGGVVLGTLVGIGAILIIPKIISVFAGNYGHYARSAEGEFSAISDMLNRIDDILGQNNIDSTNCMQRAVCTYVRTTESNVKGGSADQVDDLIHTLSENSLVDYMLDGTAIKEALENGKNIDGEKCDKIYNSCPLDSNTVMDILSKFLPANKKSN